MPWVVRDAVDEINRAVGRRWQDLDRLLLLRQLNPLSAPFWNRMGYRPLWTGWEVRAGRIAAVRRNAEGLLTVCSEDSRLAENRGRWVVLVSLIAAIVAALLYGIAAVMQAIAVRAASNKSAEDASGGVDPGLVVRLLGQWRFVVSMGLDVLGFVAQLVALRRLPLFAVQAIVAANLAVTAVVASWLIGVSCPGGSGRRCSAWWPASACSAPRRARRAPRRWARCSSWRSSWPSRAWPCSAWPRPSSTSPAGPPRSA